MLHKASMGKLYAFTVGGVCVCGGGGGGKGTPIGYIGMCRVIGNGF